MRRHATGRAGLTGILALGLLTAGVLLPTQPALAGTVGGTLEVGTVGVEKTWGDPSTMPEAWDIYDGFTVSRLNLEGTAGHRGAFNLDLRDVTRNNASGLFSYRLADLGGLTVRHQRSRQLYDADGQISAERRDWRAGLRLTPTPAFRLTADYGRQSRAGDRWALPAGTVSALGSGYDHVLQTHLVDAEVRKDGRMFAVGWEGSRLNDLEQPTLDRRGDVVSARASVPCLLLPGRINHFLRASYGRQELVEADLAVTTQAFQYLGTVRAADRVELRYRLGLDRIENDATGLQTDRTRNDVDATWRHAKGSLFAGYGFATTDDDKTLTDTNTWRLGGSYREGDRWQLRASYATSEKDDQEDLTLLRDVESNRWRAHLQVKLLDEVTVGGAYLRRERDYPALGVTATGARHSAFARLALAAWGTASVEYAYSDDEYVDRAGAFRADNSTVTARVDLTGIDGLRLGGGLTYLDLGKDLDVEKSILTFDGTYDLSRDYFVSVRYNVYNYDDYVLLDRYFTTNVVWLNVGYKLPVD
jgi:hypothetical protein